MGAKSVRHLAAFVLVLVCCVAVAEPKHKGGETPSGSVLKEPVRSEVPVAQLPQVDPKECEELAEKLAGITTEEKILKAARGIMLCSDASCMRLSDKNRKYTSTFTLHANLKAKRVELRHVKEADKELGTDKVTYSFYIESGEHTEKLLACFGNKALKATVVVQSFVKVPTEVDSHLKFRANVSKLEVVEPVAE
jgi:hypothetical protein